MGANTNAEVARRALPEYPKYQDALREHVLAPLGMDDTRFLFEADDVFDATMDAARVRAAYLPAMELLPNIGLIAVLAYGGHQVLAGSLTLGELIAFNVYVVLLIWPLRMLGMIIAQGQRSAAAATRVAEILATDPVISMSRSRFCVFPSSLQVLVGVPCQSALPPAPKHRHAPLRSSTESPGRSVNIEVNVVSLSKTKCRPAYVSLSKTKCRPAYVDAVTSLGDAVRK